MYSLALIIFVVSEKKTFEYFPIGSNVNLWPAFNIGAYGKMFQNASSLKPLGQLKPNCPGMIITKSCRSRHFEFHIGTKNRKIVEDHPMNIHVQFG
jgi:hypothetical protein